MPRRKLDKIDFIPGAHGVADIDVGGQAERTQRIERKARLLSD